MSILRKIAALSLTAVTILAGCGAYSGDTIEKPQEPTYSTLQIFTDPVTTQPTTTLAIVTTTAKQTTVKATTARQTTKSAKTTAKTTTRAARTTVKTTAAATTAAPTTATVNDSYVEYRFRNKKLLDQHFEKHGGEFTKDFGYKDASEYEKGASDVINNPDALHKTEKEDGDDIYYIEDTNEFVVLSTDGYIRTYFRPDSGKKYYDKQ